MFGYVTGTLMYDHHEQHPMNKRFPENGLASWLASLGLSGVRGFRWGGGVGREVGRGGKGLGVSES